jgi:hypothetical protein
MTNKAADIEWIWMELDDIAVLLRTHGIETLANQIDAIRKNLRFSANDHPKKKWNSRTARPAGAVMAAPR